MKQDYRHRPYYLVLLTETFEAEKINNPDYSLRDFARKLKMSPGATSEVLSGKRNITLATAKKVIHLLDLGDEQCELFLRSVIFSHKNELIRYERDVRQMNYHYLEDNDLSYKVMMEWEHYAILAYIDHSGCQHQISDFADKFSITEQRAQEVVENLIAAELMIFKDGKYQRNNFDDVVFDITNETKTLKEVRQNVVRLCLEKAFEAPEHKRHLNSKTFSIDSSRLEEAKVLMDDFKDSISGLLSDGELDEVYKINMALYPLSH